MTQHLGNPARRYSRQDEARNGTRDRGYFDGFDKALTDGVNQDNMRETEQTGKENLPPASMGKTAAALAAFMQPPENLNLPIGRAVRIVALKFAARTRG
jgi:hypothetical protein